jgi:hypothetical protein
LDLPDVRGDETVRIKEINAIWLARPTVMSVRLRRVGLCWKGSSSRFGSRTDLHSKIALQDQTPVMLYCRVVLSHGHHTAGTSKSLCYLDPISLQPRRATNSPAPSPDWRRRYLHRRGRVGGDRVAKKCGDWLSKSCVGPQRNETNTKWPWQRRGTWCRLKAVPLDPAGCIAVRSAAAIRQHRARAGMPSICVQPNRNRNVAAQPGRQNHWLWRCCGQPVRQIERRLAAQLVSTPPFFTTFHSLGFIHSSGTE